MKIVCTTDFSRPANEAVDAAVAVATRFRADLELAHAVNIPSGHLLPEPMRENWTGEAQRELSKLGKRTALRHAAVSTALLTGVPDEAIVRHARETRPDLIVMGSLGERDVNQWIIGSTAERVADASPAPVLLVRDAAPFRRWATEEKSLRVFFAYDFNETSDLALAYLANWAQGNPLTLTVAHVDRPGEASARFGMPGPTTASGNDPELQRVLERDLRARLEEHFGGPCESVRIEAADGRPEDTLLRMIRALETDLVVCGTHQRSGIARFWRGSVSLELARRCGVSVLMVPAPEARDTRIHVHRSILAVTDFSESGNEAVLRAYSLLPHGGTVHLLTVTDPRAERSDIGPTPESLVYTREEHVRNLRDLEARLRQLEPADAEQAGIHTRPLVAEELEIAAAICQTAERLGVDAISIGAGAGGFLHRLVEGSVTEEVLQRATRPVFVVRPPER